jgi:hypothetical protein
MDDSSSIAQPENFDALISEAERILSGIFGSPIHFTNVERLSEPERRNLILRCISTETSDLPSRFVIKKVEADSYHPEDPNSWDSQRFFSDWVGSQSLSSLGEGLNHGPHFYGGNRELGFIVLEDMGQHRSLVEPLLHESRDSAEAALLRYSTCLGKLHADTANRYGAFDELFHAVSPNGKTFARTERDVDDDIQKLQSSLDNLGIRTEPAFLQEVKEIRNTVVHPGPFLAYIHGDPCPDNVFDSPEQMRLIDFEFGHYGHALVDAVYGRMIFPTCWCANRLPRSIVMQMENRYRGELMQGCPQAQEDSVFEGALVTVCGYWLLDTLEWHLERALQDDHRWGLASHRQRILARLEAFMTTADDFGQLSAVYGTAGRLREVLGERWPETPPLPLYPAFQGT